MSKAHHDIGNAAGKVAGGLQKVVHASSLAGDGVSDYGAVGGGCELAIRELLLRRAFCGRGCVVKEHGHSHGADAARDGRDPRGDFLDRRIVSVADQAPAALAGGIVDPVRADIDDDSPGTDHCRGEGIRSAGGHDNDIRFASMAGKPDRAGVADRDGGVRALCLVRKEDRERPADEGGAADHDHVFAGRVDARMFEQAEYAVRGAGERTVHFSPEETAKIDGVKAVDILGRVNSVDDDAFIDVWGQGKLGQDGMEARVAIKRVDLPEEVVLGNGGGEAERLSIDANFGAGSGFARDVADGGGVFADEHRRQTRGDTFGAQGFDAPGNFGPNFRGDRFAVDDPGAHRERVPRRPQKHETGGSRRIPGVARKLAVGVDIIEIDRVADVIRRHGDRFLERVYTADEIAYCRGRISELAARFAAKEAVMKALGTGIRGVGWRDIEVLPNRRGKPLVFLYGRGAKRAQHIRMSGLEVSLTHSKVYAIASVVGERELTEEEDFPRLGERARAMVREEGLR